MNEHIPTLYENELKISEGLTTRNFIPPQPGMNKNDLIRNNVFICLCCGELIIYHTKYKFAIHPILGKSICQPEICCLPSTSTLLLNINGYQSPLNNSHNLNTLITQQYQKEKEKQKQKQNNNGNNNNNNNKLSMLDKQQHEVTYFDTAIELYNMIDNINLEDDNELENIINNNRDNQNNKNKNKNLINSLFNLLPSISKYDNTPLTTTPYNPTYITPGNTTLTSTSYSSIIPSKLNEESTVILSESPILQGLSLLSSHVVICNGGSGTIINQQASINKKYRDDIGNNNYNNNNNIIDDTNNITTGPGINVGLCTRYEGEPQGATANSTSLSSHIQSSYYPNIINHNTTGHTQPYITTLNSANEISCGIFLHVQTGRLLMTNKHQFFMLPTIYNDRFGQPYQGITTPNTEQQQYPTMPSELYPIFGDTTTQSFNILQMQNAGITINLNKYYKVAKLYHDIKASWSNIEHW
eukprot:UN01439